MIKAIDSPPRVTKVMYVPLFHFVLLVIVNDLIRKLHFGVGRGLDVTTTVYTPLQSAAYIVNNACHVYPGDDILQGDEV